MDTRQEFSVHGCFDAEGDTQAGSITVRREAEANLAYLTVDDGRGNVVTVVVGWKQAAMHATHMGAVAVHM